MKKVRVDKKKVSSLLLALGLSISPCISSADITSYAGINTRLTDGREIILFYSNENDKSLVSLNGQIGFIDNQYIADMDYDTNNYFSEVNRGDFIKVYSAPMYNDINTKNVICNLGYGSKVHIFAKTVDGYYVVYANEMMGFIDEKSLDQEIIDTNNPNLITVTKITGNNINVRSEPKKDNNIIGFCDKTDKFVILCHVDGFYEVNYLGQTGYISDKYVTEETVDINDLDVKGMVYVPSLTAFYNTDGNFVSYLPAYQNVQIVGYKDDYYKVLIDGVNGYVKQNEVKALTDTCIVIDLSRQILKVYKCGKEVFRCKVITGAKNSETRLGCFKIGHHMRGHTFTLNDIYNEYWIQFDGNRGVHPADANAGRGWQKPKYFDSVVANAYENWEKGNGKLYPNSHGSHGCVNTMIKDTAVIYSLCEKGDNVLVIEQNNFIKDNLISKDIIDKILIKF